MPVDGRRTTTSVLPSPSKSDVNPGRGTKPGGRTVNLKFCNVVQPLSASVTLMVIGKTPDCVGVPASRHRRVNVWSKTEPNDIPAGSAPVKLSVVLSVFPGASVV